jgi:hypothetical protein
MKGLKDLEHGREFSRRSLRRFYALGGRGENRFLIEGKPSRKVAAAAREQVPNMR